MNGLISSNLDFPKNLKKEDKSLYSEHFIKHQRPLYAHNMCTNFKLNICFQISKSASQPPTCEIRILIVSSIFLKYAGNMKLMCNFIIV